ncbi:hypothetical protein [Fructilactobacillus fructivorans]|uniref:hypothetical protein n=1 Tax=Fructilactobacillus fructivorans TaxID=1614 RepID=UPI000A917468|nr:hypothetical protein [Fructilactobacillus fructivorans]
MGNTEVEILSEIRRTNNILESIQKDLHVIASNTKVNKKVIDPITGKESKTNF